MAYFLVIPIHGFIIDESGEDPWSLNCPFFGLTTFENLGDNLPSLAVNEIAAFKISQETPIGSRIVRKYKLTH
ncbi:hypothetical protein RRF57_010070 [Xylaria bambusicola]|uniref:Uncharacterized protein n=1 Tax=Xylaria bambusicola TaxID=326684 RepID=A0AAN7Z9C1_9PEZI